MERRYDLNFKGIGRYECGECKRVTAHGGGDLEVHEEACPVRGQGKDSTTYVFGNADLMALNKFPGNRSLSGNLTKEVLADPKFDDVRDIGKPGGQEGVIGVDSVDDIV